MIESWLPALISLAASVVLGIIVTRLERKLSCVGRHIAAGVVRGIVEDEKLMGELQDAIIKQISNHFASSRGATQRENKGFDRRLVKGIVDRNPVLSAALDSLGLWSYIQDHPGVVFYVLSQYPNLLQMGMGSQSDNGTASVINAVAIK